ncbi:hypothetical protein DBT_2018 [Dissulfuribacter thermophilus]|uniref:Uncharacterized protein n=1 Tax=Dissulfuribacter thermophilus TaxID=1156395 RepID=A0A1B9F3G0_9BACT|nr:hypothetical protein [Dissulfuribacter thermophilus]OCC14477.1 hypothetical protein DBT_2018 [Dissulfuribacter thermophilus]
MIRYQLKAQFNTPAFIGDAFHKTLFRQWWRVVKAPELLKSNSNSVEIVNELTEQEGRLFSHSWLKYEDGSGNKKQWAMKSRFSLRLKRWRYVSLASLDKI